MDDETRAKISRAARRAWAAKQGDARLKSPETRAKMAEARRKRYTDPAERHKQRLRRLEQPDYHGMVGSPTYNSWYAMKQRCTNPNNRYWAAYGGRGITFCDQWRAFKPFLTDMGVRPPGTTLHRIDNDGPYMPGNCGWASHSAQAATRRNARPDISTAEIVGLRDEHHMTFAAIAAQLGLAKSSVIKRYRKGLQTGQVGRC